MAKGVLTDEMLPELFQAWEDGKSATEIARALGMKYGVAMSRNVIIGKVHRQREAERRARGAVTLTRLARAAKQQPVALKKAPGIPTLPKEKPVKPKAKEVSLSGSFSKERPRGLLMGAARAIEALTGCKFPIGDVAAPDFHFCNATPRDGSPYCGPHCAVAYNGIPPKKPNPRPFT